MSDLYQRDYHAWAQQQAALLRRRAGGMLANDDALDWSNIAEEIESLGASQQRSLRSWIGTIVDHLMRLEASPAIDPRHGWIDTIARTRADIADLLEDSPGLRQYIPEMLERQLTARRSSVANVLAAYGETPTVDLGGLTYTEDQVLGDWFPRAR
jgi:hypothetical protein